jgi:hypothetical protein
MSSLFVEWRFEAKATPWRRMQQAASQPRLAEIGPWPIVIGALKQLVARIR